MLLNINHIFKILFKFLGFNRFLNIMFLSIILQILVFEMVKCFSYFYFLILELWVFLVILFFKPNKIDITFLLFIFYITFFTSFLISILLLSESQDVVILFFIFITLKILFFIFIIFSIPNKEILVLYRFVLITYIFNFKIFLFLFSILFLNNRSSESMLLFFLDFFYLFLMIWILIFFIMIKTLKENNLEKYIFILLNFSHYIIFTSCFINVKVFLICSILDCFICFIVSQLIYLCHNQINKSFLGHYTPVFIFLLVSHSFGIPPFPSFILEVCFIFLTVNSLNYIVKLIVVFIIYFLIVLNFIFIFKIIGSNVNNSVKCKVLGDKLLLILILLLGTFLNCSLNIFIFLLI